MKGDPSMGAARDVRGLRPQCPEENHDIVGCHFFFLERLLAIKLDDVGKLFRDPLSMSARSMQNGETGN